MVDKMNMDGRGITIVSILLLIILVSGCANTPNSTSTPTPTKASSQTSASQGRMADFGDAPDSNNSFASASSGSYPSLNSSNGSRHYDIQQAWFGENVTNESDSWQIDNDKFDDGLNGTNPISFIVTNKRWDGDLYVNILIDLNHDGDWENSTHDGPDTLPDEWVVKNMKVDIPKGRSRSFKTNVSLPDETWMRMTLTSHELTDWFGEGEFDIGETEDYYFERLTSTPPPTTTIPPTTIPPTEIPPTEMPPQPNKIFCSQNSFKNNTFKPGNICIDDCPENFYCNNECVCEAYLVGPGPINTTPPTTTPPPSCEDKGGYSTQSACENSCQKPDFCQFGEPILDCWNCIDVICEPPLTESKNCNNQCGNGEVCSEYQSSGCYSCECEKDLDVTALSAGVSLHSSTECVNNECTTTCSLDATSNVMVINRGQGNVGASTVSVDITPGVGTNSASVPALGPGQTSQTITITHSKSAVVSGKAEACATLNWWTDTYTVTAMADSGGQIAECDEDNTLSGQTTAQ